MEILPIIVTAIGAIGAIGAAIAKLGGIGIPTKRPESIKLQLNETIIVYAWKWWPPGWDPKKIISIDDNGDSTVTNL